MTGLGDNGRLVAVALQQVNAFPGHLAQTNRCIWTQAELFIMYRSVFAIAVCRHAPTNTHGKPARYRAHIHTQAHVDVMLHLRQNQN